MQVTLNGLDRDMKTFTEALQFWSAETQKRFLVANKQAGQYWVAEAKKRVPVDEGRLRSSLRTNTYIDGDGVIVTEVGSNVEYSKHLEFGTKWIAGGAVKELGLRPDITDTQAIHDWPAKDAEATDATSAMIDSRGRRRTKGGQFASVQEQMPYLRPAFMKIRQWVIDRFNAALEPPDPKN
jgi:hypothetical protein